MFVNPYIDFHSYIEFLAKYVLLKILVRDLSMNMNLGFETLV